MELYEWQYEFDIFENNISSNKSPGHTPLEKSIILTKAQEDVLKNLYSGTNSGNGFEGSEEISEYLRTHVKEIDNKTVAFANGKAVYPTGQDAKLPDDLWFIVYEKLNSSQYPCDGEDVYVKPTTHDELSKTLRNPFRRPDKRCVLRVLVDNTVELYSHIKDTSFTATYTMRYLEEPNPIILPGCNDYINGTSEDNDYAKYYTSDNNGKNCELPSSIHRTILLRAIQIAKSIWV